MSTLVFVAERDMEIRRGDTVYVEQGKVIGASPKNFPWPSAKNVYKVPTWPCTWSAEFSLLRGGPHKEDWPETFLCTCLNCGALVPTGYKASHEKRCWRDK